MGNYCTQRSTQGNNRGVEFQRQVATEALGRYTWSCLWGFRGNCLNALQVAEQQKGRPVYALEIINAWTSIIPPLNLFFV